MNKVFITTISLQTSRNSLTRGIYEPAGFELKNNRESAFPIVPVIAENLKENDNVKIIAIRIDNAGTIDDHNFGLFTDELSELGIGKDKVTEISVAESEKSRSGLINLMLSVIDAVPEDSLVYTDITYGIKPISAVLLYGMSFIEKMKDVEVSGIYYGEIAWVNGKPSGRKLYDLTSLKNLGNVIEDLQALDVRDISKVLHKIAD